MTPAEKRFYSENFEERFTRNIAQPREYATDPNWPRLHPAVRVARSEVVAADAVARDAEINSRARTLLRSANARPLQVPGARA